VGGGKATYGFSLEGISRIVGTGLTKSRRRPRMSFAIWSRGHGEREIREGQGRVGGGGGETGNANRSTYELIYQYDANVAALREVLERLLDQGDLRVCDR
jgi:hypothetical protein